MVQSKGSSQPIEDEPAIPISDDAETHWQNRKVFSLEAYARYQDTIERIRRRHPGLTTYDIVDRVKATQGTFAWWWSAASEVRETINSINAWGVRLYEWQAWNEVVTSYDEQEDRWDILHHFLEPVAFYCMLQPSSFGDRLALTSETMLHQASRCLFPDEPDWLMQDDRPGKPLRRSDRRAQLARLGQWWEMSPAFQQSLSALDGEEYAKLTRNYRNLSTHGFAPRLLLGEISRAMRSIAPWTEMISQQDGTYLRTEHPTRKVVSYAMGSVVPLSLEETHKANLAEYQLAKEALDSFIDLASELCEKLDNANASAESR